MSAKLFRTCVMGLVGVLAAAQSSTADPVAVYSNYGPAPGFLVGTGADPKGWVLQYETATYIMGFQLTENARLSSIELPLIWGRNVASAFNVILFGARGPLEPEIDRILFHVPPGAEPGQVSLMTGESVLRPMLRAGNQYFIGAFPSQRGTIWPWSNSGATGPVWQYGNGGLFRLEEQPLAAFQLTGEVDPVPEPGTMLLLTAGAGLIARRIARNRGRTENAGIHEAAISKP